ncbi:MAG: Fe-S cluster assembly protein SufB, partial [Ruminococcus sp.]|nr:Fe-S cluster assembly protein SufB [Ruminococcus sp.]
MKEKTQVVDIDRSRYDFRYEEDESEYLESGIAPEIIKAISDEKNDPEWMREFRLKSLEIYDRTPMVDWGPDISG